MDAKCPETDFVQGDLGSRTFISSRIYWHISTITTRLRVYKDVLSMSKVSAPLSYFLGSISCFLFKVFPNYFSNKKTRPLQPRTTRVINHLAISLGRVLLHSLEKWLRFPLIHHSSIRSFVHLWPFKCLFV